MTVKYGEMINLVKETISIDQYKPKIGEANETVVVAFEVNKIAELFPESNVLIVLSAAILSPFTNVDVTLAVDAPVVSVALAVFVADVKYFTYSVGGSVDVASVYPTTLAVIPETLPVIIEPSYEER